MICLTHFDIAIVIGGVGLFWSIAYARQQKARKLKRLYSIELRGATKSFK